VTIAQEIGQLVRHLDIVGIGFLIGAAVGAVCGAVFVAFVR
jgi:hypothetical protein